MGSLRNRAVLATWKRLRGSPPPVWKTDRYINDAVVSYTLAAFIAIELLTVMGWDCMAWML